MLQSRPVDSKDLKKSLFKRRLIVGMIMVLIIPEMM